jgi:TolA-binding protein
MFDRPLGPLAGIEKQMRQLQERIEQLEKERGKKQEV